MPRQCVSLDGAGACLRSLGWALAVSQPTAHALFLLGVTQVEQPIKNAQKKGPR